MLRYETGILICVALVFLPVKFASAQGLGKGFEGRGVFGVRTFGQGLGGQSVNSAFGRRTIGQGIGGPASASLFGPRSLGTGMGGRRILTPYAVTGQQVDFGLAPYKDFFMPGTAQAGRYTDNRSLEGFDGDMQNTQPLVQELFQSSSIPPFTANPNVANGQTQSSSRRPYRQPTIHPHGESSAGSINGNTSFTRLLARMPQLQTTGSISVKMENQTAVLTGVVESQQTRDLVARICALEPGVSHVRNELVVATSDAATKTNPR